MKWNEIEINEAGTAFIYSGSKLFGRDYLAVMKFHEPGLAPVKDESGWYHINLQGEPIYHERYNRAFGYYFDRATVVSGKSYFHILTEGQRAYKEDYAWVGNYQQKLCVVRNTSNQYFHIDMGGQPLYPERYQYAGDFYENCACVKDKKGWKHIRMDGSDLNGKHFLDLGVFHKGYATAKDEQGWFHIGKEGIEIYSERYSGVEPFYNGYALVAVFGENKIIINDAGKKNCEI